MHLQEMILANGDLLTLVHLVYRSGKGWRIACVPNLIEPNARPERQQVWQRTDDYRSVTCPVCKETRAFAMVLREGQLQAEWEETFRMPIHWWPEGRMPPGGRCGKATERLSQFTNDLRSVNCPACLQLPEVVKLREGIDEVVQSRRPGQ
jgi:hypothetical protein